MFGMFGMLVNCRKVGTDMQPVRIHVHPLTRVACARGMLAHCHRQTGEVFENLLTMAYVRDSHGRRRYCVGLQLDLTGLESDDGPWGAEHLASEAGRALIAETKRKYTMLIKQLPQTLAVPAPPARTPLPQVHVAGAQAQWGCPSLAALASALGQAMPPTAGKNWTAVLYALLGSAPHAAVVVDMHEAGLPLDFVNGAFTALTAWPAAEAVGKNCRFLQSDATEPHVLAKMIAALRTYQPVQLRLQNVTKRGDPFTNDLSLHPVLDTDGACRYMIGLLADAATPAAAALTAVRAAMPSAPIDAALLPPPAPKYAEVSPTEQWREVAKANTKLIRLLWATDPDGAMRRMLSMEPAMMAQAMRSLHDFLEASARKEDVALLDTVLEQQRNGNWAPLGGRVVQDGAMQRRASIGAHQLSSMPMCAGR